MAFFWLTCLVATPHIPLTGFPRQPPACPPCYPPPPMGKGGYFELARYARASAHTPTHGIGFYIIRVGISSSSNPSFQEMKGRTSGPRPCSKSHTRPLRHITSVCSRLDIVYPHRGDKSGERYHIYFRARTLDQSGTLTNEVIVPGLSEMGIGPRQTPADLPSNAERGMAAFVDAATPPEMTTGNGESPGSDYGPSGVKG